MPRCFLLFVVIAGSSAWGQGGRKQDPVLLEAISRGRSQFQKSCGFCHGTNGDGGTEGPSLIRSGLVRHDEKGELIGPVIREGRPDKGMPRIPLDAAQVTDVVAFLHDRLSVLDRTSPGRPSRDRYSLTLLLTGNADSGKQFFNGEGGCSGCHSPAGDLARIATKYPPVELQTRFLYPVGKPSTATIELPSGPPMQGTLVRMDAFSVAIRDAGGWYHSWSRDAVKVEVHDPLAAHRELLQRMTNAHMHHLFAYLETLK